MTATSKHTHYRSLANGVIYPALMPSGEDKHGTPTFYQDEHPTEWQGATAEEYAEQNRREAADARRADVIDVVATPAPSAPAKAPAPPPPPSKPEG